MHIIPKQSLNVLTSEAIVRQISDREKGKHRLEVFFVSQNQVNYQT